MKTNYNKAFFLFLKIANIKIKLNIQQKFDFLFLKNKYVDYISKSSKYSIVVDIYFVKDVKDQIVIKQNSKHFEVRAVSLNEGFGYFSDVFLSTFIQIIGENNGLVIHASTLCYKNKGYIFMGNSGAGKSTIRKICEPVESLSDDIAIIKLIKKKYYLYGSPFYQSTKMIYPNKKVLINGIFNIEQRVYTTIEKLSEYDCFISIRNNTFILDNFSLQNDQILNLIKNVGVYKLSFEKNIDFWRMITSSNFRFLSKNNFKSILSKVNRGILVFGQKYNWVPIIANQALINGLNLINEAGWDFEFDSNKTVKLISEQVSNKNYSGLHTEIIRKIIKKNLTRNLVVVCLKYKNKTVVVDGNHRVVAGTVIKKKPYYKLIYANSAI